MTDVLGNPRRVCRTTPLEASQQPQSKQWRKPKVKESELYQAQRNQAIAGLAATIMSDPQNTMRLGNDQPSNDYPHLKQSYLDNMTE